jgi:hypothetical protein
MTAMHLDRETYRRLRSGELDAATAGALADHLDGACEVCETFLAHQPTDALDGQVDAALLGLAPASEADRGNDMEFARIRRAVKGERRSARRWTGIAMAAAAALLVGGVSLTVMRSGPTERAWDGEKGRPQPVPARLRFAVVEQGPGATKIDRGQNGAVLPQGASLAFRVELGRPAHLALLRVGPGESEVVWRHYAGRAGMVDVSEQGRPAAYPLHGLAGTQRFALVASERPLADEDLAAAARAATGASADRNDPRVKVMTLDVVEVTVQ